MGAVYQGIGAARCGRGSAGKCRGIVSFSPKTPAARELVRKGSQRKSSASGTARTAGKDRQPFSLLSRELPPLLGLLVIAAEVALLVAKALA